MLITMKFQMPQFLTVDPVLPLGPEWTLIIVLALPLSPKWTLLTVPVLPLSPEWTLLRIPQAALGCHSMTFL